MPALSGVILAGGRSRRMGQDKAFLEIGGVRLIDRVAATLATLCDELIVVANDPVRYASPLWRVVPDAFPDTGSLGGVYTGLVTADYPYCVVVACDMPSLNAALLRYLSQVALGWDAAIPRASSVTLSAAKSTVASDQGMLRSAQHDKARAKDIDLQPLHAVYHRRVAAAIRQQISAADLRMIGFLPHIRVRYVEADEIARYDPDGLSFSNANTPDEWQRVLEQLDA